MGQRLVVTIKDAEKDLMKIYYHWSGYPVSATGEALQLCKYIKQNKYLPNKILMIGLIHFIEEHGGGINGGKENPEFKYIQSLYPNEKFKEDDISRNYGLVSMSTKDMESTQNWSEGDLDIDLSTGHVINYIPDRFDNYEDYKENHDEYITPLPENEIFELETDVFDFNIEDCERVEKYLDDNLANINYKTVKNKDGEIYYVWG